MHGFVSVANLHPGQVCPTGNPRLSSQARITYLKHKTATYSDGINREIHHNSQWRRIWVVKSRYVNHTWQRDPSTHDLAIDRPRYTSGLYLPATKETASYDEYIGRFV